MDRQCCADGDRKFLQEELPKDLISVGVGVCSSAKFQHMSQKL